MRIQTRFKKEKAIVLIPTIQILKHQTVKDYPINFSIEFYWIIFSAGFRFYNFYKPF